VTLPRTEAQAHKSSHCPPTRLFRSMRDKRRRVRPRLVFGAEKLGLPPNYKLVTGVGNGGAGPPRRLVHASAHRDLPATEDTNGAPEGAIGGADRAADLRSALRSRRRVPAPGMRVHVYQAFAKCAYRLLRWFALLASYRPSLGSKQPFYAVVLPR
jgi:hypothetical protein